MERSTSAVSRRVVVTGLLALVALPALAHPGRHRHPHGRGPRVRPRRRIRRRRVRRRVVWRTVRGRRVLVVPTALAIGWELVVDDRVVVVTEVHEHRVVVEHADGSKESIDVVKEDSGENAEDLEGSEYEVEEDAEE